MQLPRRGGVDVVRPVFCRCHVVCLPYEAGLAQSVERQALNLMVEGSSPSVGVIINKRVEQTLCTMPGLPTIEPFRNGLVIQPLMCRAISDGSFVNMCGGMCTSPLSNLRKQFDVLSCSKMCHPNRTPADLSRGRGIDPLGWCCCKCVEIATPPYVH
jgi:hypothetical protein